MNLFEDDNLETGVPVLSIEEFIRKFIETKPYRFFLYLTKEAFLLDSFDERSSDEDTFPHKRDRMKDILVMLTSKPSLLEKVLFKFELDEEGKEERLYYLDLQRTQKKKQKSPMEQFHEFMKENGPIIEFAEGMFNQFLKPKGRVYAKIDTYEKKDGDWQPNGHSFINPCHIFSMRHIEGTIYLIQTETCKGTYREYIGELSDSYGRELHEIWSTMQPVATNPDKGFNFDEEE